MPAGLDGGATAVGLATMLCATLAWSLGSFTSGRMRLPPDPFVATTFEMLAGGVALLVAAAVSGSVGRLDRADLTPDSIAAWAYLVVFGSLIALHGLRLAAPARADLRVVTHQYVNPLVAIVLGALLLDERLTSPTLLGAR